MAQLRWHRLAFPPESVDVELDRLSDHTWGLSSINADRRIPAMPAPVVRNRRPDGLARSIKASLASWVALPGEDDRKAKIGWGNLRDAPIQCEWALTRACGRLTARRRDSNPRRPDGHALPSLFALTRGFAGGTFTTPVWLDMGPSPLAQGQQRYEGNQAALANCHVPFYLSLGSAPRRDPGAAPAEGRRREAHEDRRAGWLHAEPR